MNTEPILLIGILDPVSSCRGDLRGRFRMSGRTLGPAPFSVEPGGSGLRLSVGGEHIEIDDTTLLLSPVGDATFAVHDVVIGVKFHWERKETQVFEGALRVVRRIDGTIAVVNEVSLERYLTSVISSEMSAQAPMELLKAHAITSRSWLVAMLDRGSGPSEAPGWTRRTEEGEEIVRWYTREDHDLYQVCADDHCQRYQGVTKIFSDAARGAIESTRGLFLTHEGRVCDARYYKACGGLTDEFRSSWEEMDLPYLRCVSDAPEAYPPLRTEEEARRWILASPPAYCNTRDPDILRQILPSFDQETTDFFRWTVTYERQELDDLIRKKSGVDFGELRDLVPVQRGPSGRIIRLRVVGSRRSVVVGKDLEIRRWLSPSHLYSSAFVVRAERDPGGAVRSFTLHGAGWGHGVGLCQIGAAVMAVKGFRAEEIVTHYFPGAALTRLY